MKTITLGVLSKSAGELLDMACQMRSEAQIRRVLSTLCDAYSVDYFTYFVVPPSRYPGEPPNPFHISNFPQAWIDRYISRDYFYVDPIVAHCLERTTPVLWSSLQPGDDPSSQRACELLREAQEFGLVSGVSFPIHGAHRETGILSIAASADYSRCAARIQQLLPIAQLLLAYIHEAALQLRPMDRHADTRLTLRERECLRWAADGKTSWEIAQILALSERTVNFHLNNIMTKLQASNRTQAIARAVALSLITLDV